MIPADEHDYTIGANAGPRGPRHAVLICDTCAATGRSLFWGHTLALAVKAHRQHVAATDLARQENTR